MSDFPFRALPPTPRENVCQQLVYCCMCVRLCLFVCAFDSVDFGQKVIGRWVRMRARLTERLSLSISSLLPFCGAYKMYGAFVCTSALCNRMNLRSSLHCVDMRLQKNVHQQQWNHKQQQQLRTSNDKIQFDSVFQIKTNSNQFFCSDPPGDGPMRVVRVCLCCVYMLCLLGFIVFTNINDDCSNFGVRPMQYTRREAPFEYAAENAGQQQSTHTQHKRPSK